MKAAVIHEYGSPDELKFEPWRRSALHVKRIDTRSGSPYEHLAWPLAILNVVLTPIELTAPPVMDRMVAEGARPARL